MAQSKDPNLIDGFASVQAVRRVADRKPAGPGRAPDSPGGEPPPDGAAPAIGQRIVHTTLPEKFRVVCYDCGYGFLLTGRLADTYCPKCRATLKVEDQVFDSDCSAQLKTLGRVTIARGATFTGGDIVAGEVHVRGAIAGGTLAATRRLVLADGARFPVASLKADLIVVEAGACVVVDEPFHCRNIEIEGELHAALEPAGSAVIKPGGCLLGRFAGASLIVEDGGGLKAMVRLEPEDKDGNHDDKT